MKTLFSLKTSDALNAAKKSWGWITVNFVGLLTFVYLDSSFTKSIGEYDPTSKKIVYYFNFGDAIKWDVTVLPVALAMFLINTIWLLSGLLRKNRPTLIFWIILQMLWICVWWFTRIHFEDA